ncbi:MAG TPA: hypothetical protein VNN76_08975 [Bacteroidota bacterium]|nr:hypothetical protein [Bacteroidota bacterium]
MPVKSGRCRRHNELPLKYFVTDAVFLWEKQVLMCESHLDTHKSHGKEYSFEEEKSRRAQAENLLASPEDSEYIVAVLFTENAIVGD